MIYAGHRTIQPLYNDLAFGTTPREIQITYACSVRYDLCYRQMITAYHSAAPWLPLSLEGSVLVIFLVFCVVLCFGVGFFLRLVSCAPNVSSVSGMFIFYCPFGFL